MTVTALKADGFKNLTGVMIEPHPKYNLITGLNAQGKTNLLECVWLMTGCRSFRGSRDRDNIGIGRDIMDIGLRFDDGRREQSAKYLMSRENIRKKQVSLNGVPMRGTSGLFDSFKAVVFTPDDTELIKGSPEKRRGFADLCLSQLQGSCITAIRRYDLIIEQRNALLKAAAAGKADRSSLDVWNTQAAASGTLLSQKREGYIKRLSEVCGRLYGRISGGSEKLTIEYSSNIYGSCVPDTHNGNDAVALYYDKLYKSTEDDIRLGFTSRGAHRDDMVIRINGLPIKDFGSQGQKKTAALVLKLGQAEIYYDKRAQAPVILLDDVMGELDKNRQRLVFEIIKNMQVFITTCNERSVADLSDGYVYRVEGGRVTRQE